MNEAKILRKLSDKLQYPPSSEEDAIYILCQIRKILEIKKYPAKYTILNFYCNLALHSKISRPPKEVSDKFKKIQEDTNLTANYDMTYFGDFHKQLKEFLLNYYLPNFYDNNFKISEFNKLLYAIFSDTPIFTEVVSRYKTTFDEDGGMSGSPVD